MTAASQHPAPPATCSDTAFEPWLNRVHPGDCLESMKKLPAASVGLVLTSPPYNLRNSTGNGMKDGRGSKWAGAQLRAGYDTHDDNMPHDKYVAWQRDCLTEMMRLLTVGGAIFYVQKWRVQGGLLQERHDILDGFPVRQIIIWQRSGGFNFNPGYFVPTYEVIYLIASRGSNSRTGRMRSATFGPFLRRGESRTRPRFLLNLPSGAFARLRRRSFSTPSSDRARRRSPRSPSVASGSALRFRRITAASPSGASRPLERLPRA